jgi:hypothetical protein
MIHRVIPSNPRSITTPPGALLALIPSHLQPIQAPSHPISTLHPYTRLEPPPRTMGSRRSDSVDKKAVSWGQPPFSSGGGNPPAGSSSAGYTYPPTVPGSSSSFGGKREDEEYLVAAGGLGIHEGYENGNGHKRQRRDSEMFGSEDGVENR